jgi:hypothetical protein
MHKVPHLRCTVLEALQLPTSNRASTLHRAESASSTRRVRDDNRTYSLGLDDKICAIRRALDGDDP